VSLAPARGYVTRVRAHTRSMACAVGALATLVLVVMLGGWLGTRLNPLGRRGRGVFGPRAMPDFVGRDQNGHSISAADLRGYPVIGDFIFTRCRGVCPTLTAHMVALQRATPASRARFVSFSLDPDYDTPAVLKAYAARWKGDPARWRLVTLEPESLETILAAVESASASDPASSTEPHTTRFFLIDALGAIRGTYPGEDLAAIGRLAADAAALRR
jgi:protein SCO1/2